jgi:hypothetical protein
VCFLSASGDEIPPDEEEGGPFRRSSSSTFRRSSSSKADEGGAEPADEAGTSGGAPRVAAAAGEAEQEEETRSLNNGKGERELAGLKALGFPLNYNGYSVEAGVRLFGEGKLAKQDLAKYGLEKGLNERLIQLSPAAVQSLFADPQKDKVNMRYPSRQLWGSNGPLARKARALQAQGLGQQREKALNELRKSLALREKEAAKHGGGNAGHNHMIQCLQECCKAIEEAAAVPLADPDPAPAVAASESEKPHAPAQAPVGGQTSPWGRNTPTKQQQQQQQQKQQQQQPATAQVGSAWGAAGGQTSPWGRNTPTKQQQQQQQQQQQPATAQVGFAWGAAGGQTSPSGQEAQVPPGRGRRGAKGRGQRTKD